MKHVIQTNQAPEPIGPYSQAIKTGNLVFVSGQIALNPTTGNLALTNLEEETHQVMKNLEAILKEAGSSFQQVVKSTIFLSDMNLFSQVNAIYASYFTGDYPARETVQAAGLPRGVNVEISVISVCE
jgi:2-iminobutanoate/2-iminopropanoate deaminase